MAAQPAAGRGPGGKRKRVVLTLQEKVDLCARLEKGESRTALMREYNVGLSTLYDIRAHKARLLRFLAGAGGPALERRRTLHTPRLERLDRALHAWFLARRAQGLPVSGPALVAKARELHAQLRLTEPCVFSGGWLWRFKARHGIRKLSAAGGRRAADRRAAERFCGLFRSLVAEHGLTPEQVYAAGETGLCWQRRPGPATAAEDEPAPGGRQGGDGLTVLLCANAAGSHRIKPLVTGKCGGAQHLPAAGRAPGTAWAGRAVLADWFHHVFAPAVWEHLRALGLPADSKAVLLLAGSRAHPPASELVAGSIFTVFLPAGAALLQPMDQGIRRGFLENLASPPGPPPGCPPRHGGSNATGSVARAWDAVPAAVFRHAWGRLWPGASAPAEGSSSGEGPERPGAGPYDQTFAHGPELGGQALEEDGAPGLQAGAGRPAQCPPERTEEDGALGLEDGAPELEAGAERTEEDGAPGLQAGAGHPAQRPPERTEEDDGGLGAAGRGEEAPWEQAAAAFDVVLGFAAAWPCFSAQELGQLRALRSVLARWRRPPLRAVVQPEGPRERSGGRAPAACAPCPASEN